jgi:hypothetical protein
MVTSAELRRLRPFMVVEACWEDAFSTTDSMTLDQARDTDRKCMRYSLGYVVRADKEYVVIAATDDRADKKTGEFSGDLRQVSDVITLPTAYVHGIRVVEKAQRR